mmetsp:Transcript_26305/g.40203  ORF Transcript_26305/g.40203 Transcript_26305/m.40203 type:complete len:441 (-) Transcript_26305:139-1461(-)
MRFSFDHCNIKMLKFNQIVSTFSVLIIVTVASFLLSNSDISNWMAGQKDHYMMIVNDDSKASVKEMQECSLKKQWRPANSTSSTCPKAWPLASNGVGCCNKEIASFAYTSENHHNSSSGGGSNGMSTSCETQEQQLRIQGASLLQGKTFFFIGDSVGHHWLNSMLLDAHNNNEQGLFPSNTSIWKEYLNQSSSYYEYDERGFCAFPFQGLNMSSVWPSAPSIVSASYPNMLCPPPYKKPLSQQCCPGRIPISYTGAISAKLNETHPDIVIAQLGVHFHTVSQFKTVLKEMLETLGNYSALNPDSLVLFKESLPQHFDSPDGSGSYDGYSTAVNRSAWQCVPHNSSQIESDMLLGNVSVSVGMHNFNRIARRAVEEMKGGVQWLSSNSEAMALRNDGHTGATACCARHTDCTHFCYSPNLYQPTIDPFYSALKGWFRSVGS